MLKKECWNINRPYFITLTCSLGTALEWYDFTIYAYLAPIFAQVFFPHYDHMISILFAYSIFAVGFISRPIGAILFGHFSDKVGRKNVLIFNMLFIAISTFCMGLLPTYTQAGKLAPVLLIILRILQGITIGGEMTGASSLIIESTGNSYSSLTSSIIWASSGAGILLASIVVSIITFILTSAQLSDWGWRLPFLFAALTGIIGYYLRINIAESPQYKKFKKENKILKFPLIEAANKLKQKILSALMLYILSAMITYLVFVYMPVYAAKIVRLPPDQTMLVNTIIMTLMIILVPLFGHYSDILGRKRLLLGSSLTLLLLSIPLYIFICKGRLINLIIAQLLLAIFGSAYQGAITKTVLEIFPINVRCSAAGLGYNLAYSIFGGTTPAVVIYLINALNYPFAPGIYLTLGALVSFIAALQLNKHAYIIY